MSDDEKTLNQILRAWDAGPYYQTEPPTRVMHLPAGAPAPRGEIPARSPKVPFLKWIAALAMIDAALIVITAMYWFINWERIWG